MLWGWFWHHVGDLCIKGINAIIAALAAAVSAVFSLLPSMPTLPTMPTQVTNVLGWINWFFPVGTVVDIMTFFVSAWLIWMLVRVALRWGKVIAE